MFTRQLLAPRRLDHILLVTSAIHMQRALAAFRKVGFEPDAAPADFKSGGEEAAFIWRCFPSSNALLNSMRSMNGSVFGRIDYEAGPKLLAKDLDLELM